MLTVISAALRDFAGLSLDGDGDGLGGDNYIREFYIDGDTPEVIDSVLTEDTGISSSDGKTSDATPEIVLTFNEPVTGSASDILVIAPDSSVIVPERISWAGNTVTVGFDTDLVLDGQYRITLDADGITDQVGKHLNDGTDYDYYFTLDRDMPLVNQVLINNGSAQRSNIEQVRVTFSESIDVQSLINNHTIDDYIKLYPVDDPTEPVSWLDDSHFSWYSYYNRLTIDLTVDSFYGSVKSLLEDGSYELRLTVRHL